MSASAAILQIPVDAPDRPFDDFLKSCQDLAGSIFDQMQSLFSPSIRRSAEIDISADATKNGITNREFAVPSQSPPDSDQAAKTLRTLDSASRILKRLIDSRLALEKALHSTAPTPIAMPIRPATASAESSKLVVPTSPGLSKSKTVGEPTPLTNRPAAPHKSIVPGSSTQSLPPIFHDPICNPDPPIQSTDSSIKNRHGALASLLRSSGADLPDCQPLSFVESYLRDHTIPTDPSIWGNRCSQRPTSGKKASAEFPASHQKHSAGSPRNS